MRERSRVFTDTSDFFSIERGDRIQLGGRSFEILGNEQEGRFGMSDPKFWVKRAIDLEASEEKILKLVFNEDFMTTLGGVEIYRFRNPEKEAAVLELVKNHPHFMHGTSTHDEKGNNIRILDVVRGDNLYTHIRSLDLDYETYFQNYLPDMLTRLIKAFEAIRFLHSHGYKHGDIRNDHLFIERGTGTFVWIDFDYDYDAGENPYGLDIFGLGSILTFAVGMGLHHFHDIKNNPADYGDLIDRVKPEDFSILHKGRYVNVREVYPMVPKVLNDILLHFSVGAEIYYEAVDEMVEDLNRSLYLIYE